MGLRFRRSVKIAPGIRSNVGLKGSSFTFGPRGAKITVGSHGTRLPIRMTPLPMSIEQFTIGFSDVHTDGE
jgi:Protein of unknown function (DUF4236)